MIQFFIFSSIEQFYDFRPDVGLIMAGGTVIRDEREEISRNVTLSNDYGQTKETLTVLPSTLIAAEDNELYNIGLRSACLVIVNASHIFIAGGTSE